jgi:hypothetical protein
MLVGGTRARQSRAGGFARAAVPWTGPIASPTPEPPVRTAVERRTVDLSAYPDLVVIYLGMQVCAWRGLKTVLGLGPQIEAAGRERPNGLLHCDSNLIDSLRPLHVGMRWYWRDFESMARRARGRGDTAPAGARGDRAVLTCAAGRPYLWSTTARGIPATAGVERVPWNLTRFRPAEGARRRGTRRPAPAPFVATR